MKTHITTYVSIAILLFSVCNILCKKKEERLKEKDKNESVRWWTTKQTFFSSLSCVLLFAGDKNLMEETEE